MSQHVREERKMIRMKKIHLARLFLLTAPAVLGCEATTPLTPTVAGDALLGVAEHGGGPPSGPPKIDSRDLSPRSLVFYSARDGNLEIYSMNTDGGDQRRVTDHPADDIWPDLSRDGRFVTFASNRTGDREIFVQDLMTGSVVNVSQSSADDNWPRWSPDGHEIAFHSNRDGNYELYVARADGTGPPRRVTNNSLLDQWPDWSPDGKSLAFRRGMDVWVIDADGEESNPRQLTFLPTLDQMPVWSPNGKHLAFMSFREGYCSVFVMGAAGDLPSSPAVNLTPKDPGDPNSAWCSRAPAWSRYGQEILFMSFRPVTGGTGGGFNEIFVMNADGSNVRRLTTSALEDGGPQGR